MRGASTDIPPPDLPPKSDRDFGIVGVGASAGGLEAFQELLAHLPPGLRLAFVFVSHLDPHHASGLVEILGRARSLDVVEATDGMELGPGRVAVIPPNASLTIRDGVLHVDQRPPGHGGHRPIDHFLRSLADDAGNRAIGIVLSGGLSDGTLGMAAIKAAGGVTFVQDPDTAKHDSMPRSAVASGVIDFVLPIEGMARELARIGVHPHLVLDGAHADARRQDVPVEERALQAILRMLRGEGGIDFAQYRQTTVRRRIARRMFLRRLATLEAYRRQLKGDPDELRALRQDLLIDVTRFFRDGETFETLRRGVLPGLVGRAVDEDRPIRCWAPGCATGEETYSLAIVLLEVLGEQRRHAPIQVFGSDASDTAIDTARHGVYPKNIEADVSEERLQRFFTKVDDHYHVRKSVRDLCVFARHDVLADPPFSHVDLIACRNLLIYFEPPAQKRIMRTLHYALRNEGILVLGESETIGTLADLFDAVDKKHRIYAKKATSVRLDVGALGMPRGAEPLQPTSWTSERLPSGGEPSDPVHLQREVDRVLLGRAPAAVLINEAMEVLQFRGHTSPFLEPASGHASFNVLRMAREGLLMPLRTAIAAVRKGQAPVRREGVNIGQNGAFIRVNLEVLPVSSASGGRNYLVLFEHARPPRARAADQARTPVATKERAVAGQTEALRQELASTREFLQSLVEEREAANEELRSANEEVLSANEELQSTNEELQTAKEELQSTNEELNTVNEELQHRNTELGRLNDDLTNVLTSINLPLVIVDEGCTVRRFTPLAAAVFGLTAADVGRPLRTVRSNLGVTDLAELCTSVINTAMATEREVADRDDRWWNVTVRPYRTADNRIAGAVVVFTDISVLKGKLDETTIARDYAESVVNTVRVPLLVLNADLSVRRANPSFYETFKVDPEGTAGRFLYDLGNRQWDVPDLRRALQAVIEQQAPITDFEVTYESETLGRRTTILNARQIVWKDRSTGTILLAIEDVTERLEVDRLRAAALAAETEARAKDDFLAVLSHELRTPLNAMLGWIRMLQSGMLDAKRSRHALQVVERNTRVQARLVEDLLDVSRLIAGKLRVEHRRRDIRPLVEATLEAYRPEADSRGVEIVTRLDPAAGAVMADAVRMDQIVSNLLANALKFTQAGGRVEVRLDKIDGQIQIQVSDTGRGISPEGLVELFQPVSGFRWASTRRHGGLGIGLVIARHLVELHGGTIRAESPGDGLGSTFTVTLPSAPAATPDGGLPAESTDVFLPRAVQDGPRLDGLKVLVVDDERDTLELIVAVLSMRGASVTAVPSVAAALDAIKRNAPDVLVTDIAMPGEDGYSLVSRVRKLPSRRGRGTPAVALTAHARPEERERALAAGFQLHLAKPIEPDELCAAVAHLARREGPVPHKH